MKQNPILSFVGLILVQFFLIGCATQSAVSEGGDTSSGDSQSSQTNPASPDSAANNDASSTKEGDYTPSDAEITKLAADITSRWNQAKRGNCSKESVDDYYHSFWHVWTEKSLLDLLQQLPDDFSTFSYSRNGGLLP